MACLHLNYAQSCSMARLQPKKVFQNLVVSDWFTPVPLRCDWVFGGTVFIKVAKWLVAGGSCSILQRLKARYTSLLSLLGFLPAPSSASLRNLPLARRQTFKKHQMLIYWASYVPETMLALGIWPRIKHRFCPKWLQSMKVFDWW